MTRGPDPAATPREILLWMLQSTDPAFTAAEVASGFDKTRQWAHQQLTSLEEDGLLDSKNPGRRTRFYWVTDDGRDYLDQTRPD